MLKRLLRLIKSAVVRVYALGIMLLVIWTFYAAVSYLVRSIFWPTPIPQELLEWKGRVPAEAMRKPEPKALDGMSPRAPLSHYHRVGRWFQADPHNGCTTNGCHSPLPHTKHAATRAFANFHGIFLSCQMCHQASTHRPEAVAWVSAASGQVRQPPPILQLASYLEVERNRISEDPAGAHPVIVELLTQTVEVSGGDPILDYLRLEVTTSEPGSPVWLQAVAQLASELSEHMRGEYGAKLAPRGVAEGYVQLEEQLTQQAQRYLSAPADSPERRQIHREIHASLMPKPRFCLACHGGQPPMIDFASLGYSPKRVSALRKSVLADEIERLERGGLFRLPLLLQEAPTTAPIFKGVSTTEPGNVR
jgi:hypothetical protein